MRLVWLVSLIGPIIILIGSSAIAQSNKTPEFRVEPTLGPFVVKNAGADDVIGSAGIRLSKGVYSFRPEFFAMHGRENGAIYYTYSMSVLNTLELEGLEPFWYIGLTMHEYKAAPTGNRAHPLVRTGGLHFGFGTYVRVNPYFAFRSDIVLYKNPGKAVFVGIGMSWVVPLGDSAPGGEANQN